METVSQQQLIICILLVLLLTVYFYKNRYSIYNEGYSVRNFTNFDQVKGSDVYIVPNWIHVIRLGKAELGFVEAVCLLAALKNQNPDYLFIHSDLIPNGTYWDVVKRRSDKIRLMKITAPNKIFGKEIQKSWRRHHGADILRLRILRTYGGIYLDTDSYLVRDVNHFRRYEISLGWSVGKPLQNQIIIAHKDARLLKLWLKGYEKDYKPDSWYYNAGEYPTKILENNPEIAHAEPMLFGNYGTIRKVFQKKWPDWKNYYSIHLMVRHQYLLKNITNVATYPVKFNHRNIHTYNITFRDMVYDVYPYSDLTESTRAANLLHTDLNFSFYDKQ